MCNSVVNNQKFYKLFGTFILTLVVLCSCRTNIIDFKKSDTSIDLPIQKNLVLHLKADSGVATQGTQVTGWIDNSLIGYELIASGDPIFVANSINGQPAIRLDGNDDILERNFGLESLPTGNSDRTVFMVAKYNSNGYGGFTYGKPFNNNTFGLVVDSEGYLAVQAWGQENDKLTKVDGNGSGWLTQAAKLEAGMLSQYKNGVQLSSVAHQYNTVAEQLVVGAEINNNNHVDMEVAEIIVFDRALDDAERQKVESYLQQKYFLRS